MCSWFFALFSITVTILRTINPTLPFNIMSFPLSTRRPTTDDGDSPVNSVTRHEDDYMWILDSGDAASSSASFDVDGSFSSTRSSGSSASSPSFNGSSSKRRSGKPQKKTSLRKLFRSSASKFTERRKDIINDWEDNGGGFESMLFD